MLVFCLCFLQAKPLVAQYKQKKAYNHILHAIQANTCIIQAKYKHYTGTFFDARILYVKTAVI
jgi:hypothetical protein